MSAVLVDPQQLTFVELDQALSRCMAAHPPEGTDLKMHPDANRMADLWAAMTIERSTSVPLADVDPRVLEAFQRWILPA